MTQNKINQVNGSDKLSKHISDSSSNAIID